MGVKAGAIVNPSAALRPTAPKIHATMAFTKPPNAPAAKVRLKFRKKLCI
jgi:hypothetical protein